MNIRCILFSIVISLSTIATISNAGELCSTGQCTNVQQTVDGGKIIPITPRKVSEMLSTFQYNNAISIWLTLPVGPQTQHTPVWCWAASVAMIVSFKTGQYVVDCQVASVTLGRDCCSMPQMCMTTGNDQMMAYALNQGGIQAQMVNSPLAYSEIQQQINQGNPMILFLQNMNPRMPGHAMVLNGFTPPNFVSIIDPGDGSQKSIPVEQLMYYNNMLRWFGTMVTR